MNREQLIAAMKSLAVEKPRPVDVKGWGTVHVRRMTVEEVDRQTQELQGSKDKQRFAKAACRILCDEEGHLLFDPANEEDVKLIAKQPWDTLRFILERDDDEGK